MEADRIYTTGSKPVRRGLEVAQSSDSGTWICLNTIPKSSGLEVEKNH
jgi:hypothetical protein